MLLTISNRQSPNATICRSKQQNVGPEIQIDNIEGYQEEDAEAEDNTTAQDSSHTAELIV